jgi:hypothetical protein
LGITSSIHVKVEKSDMGGAERNIRPEGVDAVIRTPPIDRGSEMVTCMPQSEQLGKIAAYGLRFEFQYIVHVHILGRWGSFSSSARSGNEDSVAGM